MSHVLGVVFCYGISIQGAQTPHEGEKEPPIDMRHGDILPVHEPIQAEAIMPEMLT